MYIIIVNGCLLLSRFEGNHAAPLPIFFLLPLVKLRDFCLVCSSLVWLIFLFVSFCCLFHEVDPSLNLVGILARLILIMAGTPCKELGSKLDNSVVIFLQSRKYPQTRENTLLTHPRVNYFSFLFSLVTIK